MKTFNETKTQMVTEIFIANEQQHQQHKETPWNEILLEQSTHIMICSPLRSHTQLHLHSIQSIYVLLDFICHFWSFVASLLPQHLSLYPPRASIFYRNLKSVAFMCVWVAISQILDIGQPKITFRCTNSCVNKSTQNEWNFIELF